MKVTSKAGGGGGGCCVKVIDGNGASERSSKQRSVKINCRKLIAINYVKLIDFDFLNLQLIDFDFLNLQLIDFQ